MCFNKEVGRKKENSWELFKIIKLLKNLEQDQDQTSMCKSLFTFDVIKASLLVVLVIESWLTGPLLLELYKLEITYSGAVLMVK